MIQVRMLQDVRPDFVFSARELKMFVRAGEVYEARLNPQGAVSAVLGDELLGLRPGEFEFVCPLIEDGVTKLVRGHWHVYRTDESLGADFASLELIKGEWRWCRIEPT